MRTPSLPRPGTLLAAGLCLLALGGCGDGGDATTTATASGGAAASSGDGDQDAARVRLQQCLRENGVEIPDQLGGPGAGGGLPEGAGEIDQEALQAALDGPCKELQQDATGDITGEDRQEFEDAFQEFAACMRENGVEVPDITGGQLPEGGTIDMDDPEVQAATEQCSDRLPAQPGGGDGQ